MIPENILSLHKGEEFIRAKSIEAIQSSEDTLAHIRTIERSVNLIEHFAHHYVHESEDQLTIQLLGIRLFNGSAAALKLLLSGYYQASALQQRDLLETIFLLDYFSTDLGLIAVWRSSDEKSRLQKFKPVAVRIALDDRDGFTTRKRAEAYEILCKLAGHPTSTGFCMLTPLPGGDAHCGPFFELTAMKAVLEELVKHLVQAAGIFTCFFKSKSRADYETKFSFMEAHGLWFEKFYGRPFDRTSLDEMRALLSLPSQ